MKKGLALFLCAIMLLGSVSALAEEPVVVNFWSLFTGADGEQMTEILELYNQQDPMRQVQTATQDWDNYYTKVKTSIMGGEAPDLMISHDVYVWGLIKEGLLIPMDDEAVRLGVTIDYENYSDKLGQLKYEDHYYAVPLDALQLHLSYNVEVLEKAGVLDENGQPVIESGIEGFTAFVEAVAAACPDGMAAFCYPVLNGSVPWYLFNSLYYQFGGTEPFVSDDGTAWQMDEEIGLKAANVFQQIYELGLPNVSNWSDVLTSGAVAMTLGGSWQMNMMRTNMIGGEENFGVAKLPQFGPEYRTAMYSHTFVLPVNDKRDDKTLEVALDFISFFAEHNAMWSKAGSVPAYLPSWETDLFKSFPMHGSFKDGVLYDTPKTYTAPFALKGSPEVNEPLVLLANGDLTPEQFLIEIADRMNTALR